MIEQQKAIEMKKAAEEKAKQEALAKKSRKKEKVNVKEIEKNEMEVAIQASLVEADEERMKEVQREEEEKRILDVNFYMNFRKFYRHRYKNTYFNIKSFSNKVFT